MIIRPEWPSPANIVAFTTTREAEGGRSEPPYDTWNLGFHVQDDAEAVKSNQTLLEDYLPTGATPCWLRQVHGIRVVEAKSSNCYTEADAAWSNSAHSTCAVLTADCLPVLFCSEDGGRVAAAHAGWRGLLAGILERTVTAIECPPEKLMAWMGPAIGPDAFEVGSEVRDQFLEAAHSDFSVHTDRCFIPGEQQAGCYYADLYTLARLRLRCAGVERVYGGGFCTYSDSRRFYSYRRDGETGRMASVISIT